MQGKSLSSTFSEVADAITRSNFEKALEGLLWIHDNPNKADPSSEMYRRAYGFTTFAMLARDYEPAKLALLGLLETKRASVAAGSADESTEADLRALEAAISDIGP